MFCGDEIVFHLNCFKLPGSEEGFRMIEGEVTVVCTYTVTPSTYLNSGSN